jgi:hypothetical protein
MATRSTTPATSRRYGAGLLALILAGTTGCPVSDLLTGSERGDSGAPPGDASTDGAPAADATLDAAAEAVDGSSSAYYAVDDASMWAFFDVAAVGGQAGYSGIAYDGRYLYFVPDFSPPSVLRYDTQGTLNDSTAWSTHALVPTIVAAGGPSSGSYTYLGGAFDGRYLYLAPFGTNTFAVQYDTRQPFTDSGAWTAFSTTALDPDANYWGVASDGRYAYFIPNTTTTVVAYDNQAVSDAGSGFSAASSWVAYDLGAGPDYAGFWGGVFDGRYMYLAPYTGNVASRYDTTLPIGAAGSWNAGSTGFDFNDNEQITPPHYWGAAYDGSRVYMVPYKTQAWTLASYTTSGSFNDDGSWATCALAPLLAGAGGGTPGFVGAAYDGRRLFLVPAGRNAAGSGALPVVAYDTTQPLCPTDLASAYSLFDPSTLEGGQGAQGFEGAAFDGKYVYFVPHAGHVVARFQAKATNMGLSPSVYKGSWW